MHSTCTNQRGFTLLELSVALILIAVIIGGGLMILTANLQASQFNATVARMDEIEKALLNFAIANNRIPCPANLALTVASADYGAEAGKAAGGTGTGECVTAMTPAANFKSASGAEEGGVPTRALQLRDDYMYDGWGRKFRYAVDPTQTAANALPAMVYNQCNATSASAITVNDASGAARTTAAAYSLISHGANGHGAYTSNGVAVNAGSVNADELTNCHCNSSAAATTYTPTYVEKVPMQDAGNALDNFDDIVTFKEGWQMQAPNYPLSQKAAQCIYVVDANNNRVEEFSSGGTYLSQFGSLGSGNGQFNIPYGVAVDASGNIWVLDKGNNRVEKFNSSGAWLASLGGMSSACTNCLCTGPSTCPSSSGNGNGQMNQPFGLAIDASANVWVADTYNSRVEEFSSSGIYLGQFGSLGSGNGQLNYPMSISTDQSGNVWVADTYNSRVEEFSSGGSYLLQFGSSGSGNGQFNTPYGVAVDAGGNVWVADSDNNRLQKFSGSGTYLSQFGSLGSGDGQLSTPYGPVIDASGNIWVVDSVNNRVQKFSSSGTYLSQFGSSGSGNGQFNYPDAIAISSSR